MPLQKEEFFFSVLGIRINAHVDSFWARIIENCVNYYYSNIRWKKSAAGYRPPPRLTKQIGPAPSARQCLTGRNGLYGKIKLYFWVLSSQFSSFFFSLNRFIRLRVLARLDIGFKYFYLFMPICLFIKRLSQYSNHGATSLRRHMQVFLSLSNPTSNLWNLFFANAAIYRMRT